VRKSGVPWRGTFFGIKTPPVASGSTFVTPGVKGLQRTGRGERSYQSDMEEYSKLSIFLSRRLHLEKVYLNEAFKISTKTPHKYGGFG